MVVLQFALDLVPKQTKQSSLKDLGDLTPGLPLPPATVCNTSLFSFFLY